MKISSYVKTKVAPAKFIGRPVRFDGSEVGKITHAEPAHDRPGWIVVEATVMKEAAMLAALAPDQITIGGLERLNKTG